MIYFKDVDKYVIIWQFGILLILSSFLFLFFDRATSHNITLLFLVFGYLLYNSNHTEDRLKYNICVE